ncbi:hypothetical protein [Austwickia sp. TVS 96-490-7B]|uniref:hypothetical protein n=1 Tax=Austwickia sp. TVS 96-490-7B TaxID=2830843 RepID=UPI001C562A05|nr:hypothetical protein [Austwickia sp. TVS 96-490-7B]
MWFPTGDRQPNTMTTFGVCRSIKRVVERGVLAKHDHALDVDPDTCEVLACPQGCPFDEVGLAIRPGIRDRACLNIVDALPRLEDILLDRGYTTAKGSQLTGTRRSPRPTPNSPAHPSRVLELPGMTKTPARVL